MLRRDGRWRRLRLSGGCLDVREWFVGRRTKKGIGGDRLDGRGGGDALHYRN